MNLDDFQKYLNNIGKKVREQDREMADEIFGEIFPMLNERANILYPAPEDFQARLKFKISILGVIMEECLKEAPQDMAQNGAIIVADTLITSIFLRDIESGG